MRRAGFLHAFALALAAALVVGCAETVQVKRSPELGDRAIEVRRIAVTPFRTQARAGGAAVPADASPLVSGYVADALTRRGLDVIAPSDLAHTLPAPAPGQPVDPREAARIAHERFGADAVAIGNVARFRDRSGQALGSTRPASVAFEVRIHQAPSGNLLWSGLFDQTQVSLGENLLKAPRYPGGGTRWLTAEEFARWGAGEVVAQAPLAPR